MLLNGLILLARSDNFPIQPGSTRPDTRHHTIRLALVHQLEINKMSYQHIHRLNVEPMTRMKSLPGTFRFVSKYQKLTSTRHEVYMFCMALNDTGDQKTTFRILPRES